MQHYEILLGKPICRLFNNQYPDWVWALDTIFNILGLDPEKTIADWIPESIMFTEFLKYIARIGIGNYPKSLYNFHIEKNEDYYGKFRYQLELKLYPVTIYLSPTAIDEFSGSIVGEMNEKIKSFPGHVLLERLRDAYKQRNSRF